MKKLKMTFENGKQKTENWKLKTENRILNSENEEHKEWKDKIEMKLKLKCKNEMYSKWNALWVHAFKFKIQYNEFSNVNVFND